MWSFRGISEWLNQAAETKTNQQKKPPWHTHTHKPTYKCQRRPQTNKDQKEISTKNTPTEQNPENANLLKLA